MRTLTVKGFAPKRRTVKSKKKWEGMAINKDYVELGRSPSNRAERRALHAVVRKIDK